MDERPRGEHEARRARPAVECTACRFAWHSAAMAEGLRLLGSCPRCGAELRFADDAARQGATTAAPSSTTEPHLALGLPRPQRL
ncbi:MAG TPA: hypothetical protein VF549_16465 [Solirubrobacteraceae bacterium]